MYAADVRPAHSNVPCPLSILLAAMLDDKSGHERHVRVKRRQVVQTALVAAIVAFLLWRYTPRPGTPPPPNAADLLAKCYALDMPAGPPLDFSSRTESDRYVPGTRATVVRNATIWTGGDAGTETVRGDVLLDAGMIKAVGNVPEHLLRGLEYDTLDAKGLWLTPGLGAPLPGSHGSQLTRLTRCS